MRAKRILLGAGVALGVALTAAGGFAAAETWAYGASMDKVYDVPLPAVAPVGDAAALARGKHVVEAIAGCATADCHGADLGGGRTVDLGPVGRFTGPNITTSGIAVAYSDGELARLIRDGIKRDGRSVRFMPVQDFRWLPDADVSAMIAYLRTVPPSSRPNGPTEFTVFGKVLDRRDAFVIDVARRIDPNARDAPPAPAPTPEYGAYLARGCTGCHGEHLSGGRIPGAPSSLPVPKNLTPDAQGLARWTFNDFDAAITRGVEPDGHALDPFMPTEAYAKLDETEKRALWAYLQSVPPRPSGQR